MIDWKTQDFLEANGYLVMPVPLRDTMSAYLVLPKDMTKAEATRLSRVVLAFAPQVKSDG